MANLPVEIKFAQNLAGNEKKIRDKALKKIRKYLKAKSASKKDGFSMEDFLKIWKGLHYCMWMQDKAIVQEELCVALCQLVHELSTIDAQFMFIQVFFMTEAREWNGIDVWRLDKFMMLVRNMLHESLDLVKKLNWHQDHLTRLMTIYGETVMDPSNEAIPDGLRIHFSDIYLDEVEKVGADKLDGSQLLKLLEPFITFLQRAPNSVIIKRVISRIFEPIISRSIDMELRKEEGAKKQTEEDEEEGLEVESEIPYLALQFDNTLLANHLFEISKQENLLARNRPLLYNLVKQLQDAETGALSREEELHVADDISHKEVSKAVHSLLNMENKNIKKKKHKKRKKSKANKEEGSEGKENDNSDKNNNSSPAVYVAPANSESLIEKKKHGKRKLSCGSVDSAEPLTKIKKKSVVDDNVKSEDKKSLKKLKDKFEALKGKSKKEKKTKYIDTSEVSNSSKKVKTVIESDDVGKLQQTSSSWTVTPVVAPSTSSTNTSGEHKKQQKLSSGNYSEITESADTPKSKKQKEQLNKSNKTPEKHKLSTSKNMTVEENVSNIKAASIDVPQITVEVADGAAPSKQGSKTDLPEGEIEIWVPNKKYKGNKDKTPKAGFAKFDNSKPPAAFVRKAMTKMAKTPTLGGKLQTLTPGSSTGSAKRVVFNMKKNQSQAFKDSLKSPMVPFNPLKTPEQGILKSPADGTPTLAGQHTGQKSAKSRRNSVTTPVVGLSKNVGKKRARAVDFFL